MHEEEVMQRISAIREFDRKIFETILLKRWRRPDAEMTDVPANVDEPPIGDEFDLETFVQNFRYAPLDWKSRDVSTVNARPPSVARDTDKGAAEELLTMQGDIKTEIFNALNNKDNVMGIPLLDDAVVERYWLQFAQYFNADRKRTWRLLSMALMEFLKLLQRRDKMARECNSQRRRYLELRHFFQHMLESDSACRCEHGE